MSIESEPVGQALVDAGFEEQPADLRGEGVGAIYRHGELPPPWSIIAAMRGGDARAHVDLSLQFRGQQVGTIHRVTSHQALVSNLPAIVSSLTALVGSKALTCPRCGEGWLAVGQSNPPDAQGPFFFCTDCFQKPHVNAPDAELVRLRGLEQGAGEDGHRLQPVVTYS